MGKVSETRCTIRHAIGAVVVLWILVMIYMTVSLYESGERTDPEASASLAARLEQVLSELTGAAGTAEC